MRFLGLDLGTSCGHAIVDIDKPAERDQVVIEPGYVGTWDLNPTNLESLAMRNLRFIRHVLEIGPDVIAFEAVNFRFKSTRAAVIYGGLSGVLVSWCEKNLVPALPVPVGTLKKFATGNGSANKTAMISAANQTFGTKLKAKEDDAADAAWVAQWVCTNYSQIIFNQGLEWVREIIYASNYEFHKVLDELDRNVGRKKAAIVAKFVSVEDIEDESLEE